MGESTGIAWTRHTFNPWIGCTRVSPGCGGAKGVGGCYAEVATPTRVLRARGIETWGPEPTGAVRHRTSDDNWRAVSRWDRAAREAGERHRVFCASMADVFDEHPMVAPWRAEALALLERCTNLDVQLLTKRPQNILAMVPEHWRTAWPAHVWIGTTVEDQRRAEQRIPHLLAVPAAVRFLSCEPLLGPVDLSEWMKPESHCSGCEESFDGLPALCPRCSGDSLVSTWGRAQAARWRSGERYENGGPSDDGPEIGWVIAGAESGCGARSMDEGWVRSMRDQCAAAGVPFFYKQRLNEKGRKVSLPVLDGVQHAAFPAEASR